MMNLLSNGNQRTQRLTLAGMLTAVGLLLPYVCAHGLGIQGTMFLPMHIPVFLIGLLCGPLFGVCCGVLIPLLNALLTGMPAFYPNLPLMACELGVYGLVSGLMMDKTPLGKRRLGVYPALMAAMLAGRAVYALAFEGLLLASGSLRAMTVTAALVAGLPGIAVQILVVPAIVLALRGSAGRRAKDATASAITLIDENAASCVVIKDNRIVKTAYDAGLKPLIALYHEDALKDALVVDKIIGKAAAMVLVLGGAKQAYGRSVSRAALEYLRLHGIAADGREIIEQISNRRGDGICPMERAVMDITDPREGLNRLEETIASMRQSAV